MEIGLPDAHESIEAFMRAADDLCDAWTDLDEHKGWKDIQLVGVEKTDEDGNAIGRVEAGDWEEGFLKARQRLTAAVERVVESAPATIAVLGRQGNMDLATRIEDLRQSLTRPLCQPGEDFTDHVIEGPALFVGEFVTAWTARQGLRAALGAVALTLRPSSSLHVDDDPERDVLLTAGLSWETMVVDGAEVDSSLIIAALVQYWDSLIGSLRRLNLCRTRLTKLRVALGGAGHAHVSQADSDPAPLPSPLVLRAGRALLALGELEASPESTFRVANGVADRLRLISRIYAPWKARDVDERRRSDCNGFAPCWAQVAADCLEWATWTLDSSPAHGVLYAEAGVALTAELTQGTETHRRASINADLPRWIERLAGLDCVGPPVAAELRSLIHGRLDASGVHGLLDGLCSAAPLDDTVASTLEATQQGGPDEPSPVPATADRVQEGVPDPLTLDLTTDGKAFRLGVHKLSFKRGEEMRRVTVQGPEGRFLAGLLAGKSPLPHASRNHRSNLRKALKSVPGAPVRLVDPDTENDRYRLVPLPRLSPAAREVLGLG